MTNLYDVAADPDRLKQLSRNYNQYQGIVDQNAVTNALERISNQAGYEGIITPNGIISFEPQVVNRIK
jgi:prophage maintenance system killer protein